MRQSPGSVSSTVTVSGAALALWMVISSLASKLRSAGREALVSRRSAVTSKARPIVSLTDRSIAVAFKRSSPT